MKTRFVIRSMITLGLSGPASQGAAATFAHHEDIEIRLFASEPMVVDPVAIAFAANGDAFVVEMRDYPYGVGPNKEAGGTIRLLRDTDHDGVADEAHRFAENLSFPTSVTAWRDGILVAAPPQVLYLEDSDGDDRADHRRVILDGFKLGVTDSNLNSLRWGLDGRIHGANGGAGGRVFSPLQPGVAPVKLGDHDFAFDPDTGTWSRTAHTGGGFGLVFDGAGHSFTTYNINYLQQRIIALRYLENNPHLRSFEATVNISAHGESARIYPIGTAQTRVNHPEQAGHFSAAGGMGLVESGPLSQVLGKSIFVCDVVGNLVHRDVLAEHGPVFRGARAPEEQTSEFIASSDPMFRPIGLEPGPDGALYLVDMQREVIEHPDYIPAKVLKGMKVRGGEDRGRIYRVIPRAGLPAPGPLPAVASRTELVAMLGSDNAWRADTAHRLLRERKEIPEAAPNVRALWLSCSGGPNWKLIGQALQSGSPGMRENALVLSEGGEAPDAVLSRIVRMVVEDPHPRVRFQAALSLGSRSHPGKVPALAGLLLRDGGYLWSRRAVWTAVAGNAGDLLRQLRGLRGFSAEGFDSLRAVVLEELVELAANEASSRADFYEWLAGVDLKSWRLEDQVGLLRGLRGSWSYRPPAEEARGRARACLRRFSGELSGSEEALLALHRILDEPLPSGLEASWRSAAGRARDPGLDVAERRRCVALLAEVPEGEARATLLTLLDSKVPAVLQESALEALSRNRPEDLGRKILAQWRGISPRFRPRLIQLLLRKSGDRIALLDALDARQITVQELNLDLEQRRTLLRWSSPEIARRSQPYFGDHEYSNRKALVEEWLRKLPARGDPEIGRAAFQRSCAVCHRVGKDGHAVGPDLTGVSHRSVEDLLSHILDPNMAINPNYVTCMVETHDGTILTGLLSSESENELTLTLQQGTRQRIARKAIKRKEVLPVSLMPEGMEEAFTPAEMRSLIEFLQNS